MRKLGILSTLLLMIVFFGWNRQVYAQNLQEMLSAASELEKEGEIDQAVEMCLDYYEKNPQKYEVLQSIAELYNRNERYDEAIEYMEKLIIKDADFLFQGARFKDQCDRLLRAWDSIGKGNIIKAGGIELATKYYKAKINDKNTTSRMKAVSQIILGDIAEKAKDLEKQREHYYKAYEQVISASDDWEKAVNRVLQRKFMDKAWYDDAVAVYTNYPDYSNLIQLGQWLKRQGRGYEMIDLYEDYLLHGNPEKEKYYSIGGYEPYALGVNVIDELVSVGRGESLIGQFNDLIATDPKNPELHRRFGYMLIKMRRNEEALREIEQYLSSKEIPSASDYEWAGDLCEQAKISEIAIQYYEIARDTEVTDIEVYRASTMSQMAAAPSYWKQRYKTQILEKLGNIYIRQKQWPKAESCFKEIMEMDANYRKEVVQKKLALIWEQMGKDNVFIESMKEKIIEQPENEQVIAEYANTLLNSNKTDEAVKQYEKAVELSPEDISLRLKLADSLAEDKQNDRAIDEYRTALFMSAQKNENEFNRGKGGDEREPWFILNKLSRFCEKVGQKDKILDIDVNVLVMLDSPDTNWKPDKYVRERILRDMTEIYEAKGQYSSIIELWLGYHKKTGYYSRYVIKDQLQYVENLKPFIERLQKETSGDSSDYWGKFILADILYAQNDKDDAMEIYKELLKDATTDGRLQHDLIYEFQYMQRYDLMLDASIKALAQYGHGGRDYGQALGNIAGIYLKLDNKEKAAEFYRNAMACDVSQEEYEQFSKALSNITGENQVHEHTESVAIKPLVDLDKMRSQAERMYWDEKDYPGAEKLYKQILEIAPLDLESMVRLGEVYERMYKTEDATAIFEKVVFDKEMRLWAPSPDAYYGANSELQGIYSRNKDIKKVISLFALTGSGNLEDIKRNCRNDRELQEFHSYLMEQSQEAPDNTKLNLYLVRYFAETGETERAQEIAGKLYNRFSDDEGHITNRNNAIELAKSYESMGQFEKALSVLSYFDYENDNDVSFDSLGEILVRLYAKANRFDKALVICGLRLKKDPRGYKTKEIAEQISQNSVFSDNGPQLLKDFFDTIKNEIPESNYNQFRGAVLSYLETHPELTKNRQPIFPGTDSLTLLKQGRIVHVPQNCRSFADFLEKLALQANTIAVGSFMGRYGENIESPNIASASKPAFEILTEALDGRNIPMVIDQKGYWEFNEVGDKNRRFQYAASGGVIWEFEGFYPQNNESNMRLFGYVLSIPSLERDIVAIQSTFTVIDAVDSKGKRVEMNQPVKFRHLISQIQVSFNKPEQNIEMIKKMKINGVIAVCTKWSTFTINQLDYDKPISLQDDSMTIEIETIKETMKESKREWDINMTVQSKDKLSNTEPAELKYEMFFISGKEKKPIYTVGGIYKYKNTSKLRIHSEDDSLNPSTTSLLIRFPAKIEIVPFEVTLNDIPVIHR